MIQQVRQVQKLIEIGPMNGDVLTVRIQQKTFGGAIEKHGE
jgi:hypothetical protein